MSALSAIIAANSEAAPVRITSEAAAKAARAPVPAVNGPSPGCARVYVGFGHRLSAAEQKALAGAGLRLMPRPHTKRKFAYIGYDNLSGTVLAKAEGIAAAFEAMGIDAYSDYDLD